MQNGGASNGKLAEEYRGKSKFVKLDVDDSPEVANKFGVASIPTLIIFKQGKPVTSCRGYGIRLLQRDD